MCVFSFRYAAQISDKASGFEEKDRKPDRQGVPRAGQEQPPNLQLPGIVRYFLNWEFLLSFVERHRRFFCLQKEAGFSIPLS